jgi:hypothetical protein
MKRKSAVDTVSRRKADAISLCLVLVIICLATALLFMGVPPTDAMLSTEQINEMPLFGP